MKIITDGETREYRTVWLEGKTVKMIDQSLLPFTFRIIEAGSCEEIAKAIRDMVIRGTLTISAAGAFAIAQTCLAYRGSSLDELRSQADSSARMIMSTRPTGVDLSRTVQRVMQMLHRAPDLDSAKRLSVAEAQHIADEDVEACRRIGKVGSHLLKTKRRILTHCNTGLGAVDYGTAMGVIRYLHSQGKTIEVYITETRPWSQGARLTTWELLNEGIPHYLIADCSAGLLMQRKMIDACIVGADRIACNGDTVNKIGSYQLAVLAKENKVPFYVAAPVSTFDLGLKDGHAIPIEERDEREVLLSPKGLSPDGQQISVRIAPQASRARNFVFDITPSMYVTAFVTEKGIVKRPYSHNIKRLLRKIDIDTHLSCLSRAHTSESR
jgi:methylthioribose-1-phosphate isomerase